ncbi:hypothetical protein Glove_9g262 [Diversispora epigaea]|uniref:HMG box domain-containing protein n=1 Tax=Diversispora epigaea TaxID=1348612 RepID=A0A397JUW5_9GLOM|nr:hypothetical protein Glove_9g262 [Diversispora epigaea]
MVYQNNYQVIKQPIDNNKTYDFIFETGEVTDDTKTKRLERNAKTNKNIVRLINVPFPPELNEEDLIKPRNDKCDKVKVPNKFFIYRKWYTMCLSEVGQKNDQTSIAPYISEQWRNEPEYVKNYYGTLSMRAGELFKQRYGKNDKKQKIKDENFNSIDQVMSEPPHSFPTTLCHLPNNFISYTSLESSGVHSSNRELLLQSSHPESQYFPYPSLGVYEPNISDITELNYLNYFK